MNQAANFGPGGATRLTHWGVIRAEGADAASFLHGQLSNDFSRLDSRHARLAAYCTAQGRMLASLIGCKHSPEDIWLACSADVLPATLKRLSMFVLRAKARLSDASSTLLAIGLAGSSASAWLGSEAPAAAWDKADRDGASIVRLPDAEGQPRWLWLGPAEAADAVLAALPALTPELWRWLEVRSGVAHIVAATSGQLVPQMLNYELVGGVDFKKGCYPGQEVVARSQYLGKLKRRAFLLSAEAELQPGQEVVWSEDPGQPAGVIALSAPNPTGGWSALAELKLGATAGGSLHLGNAEGAALSLQPLPYTLPHEASSA
jgi:folate-binding protein YgfZ